MTVCLIHERTFARVKERVLPEAGEVEFALMHDDGRVLSYKTGEVIDAPDPNIAFGNADMWFGDQAGYFFKLVLGASRLDWFQSAAAGVDIPALQKVVEKAGVYTTNHTQAEAMAEWAIWQALDWMKKGSQHRQNQKETEWKRLHQREIMGSNWLIVGYGSIGKAVARRVKALGGNVTGVRRSLGTDEHADRIVSPDDMFAELPKADVVLLCLPLTSVTENIANADFFAAMREGETLFMNLGRGGLVDEAALIAEMDRGRPAHAALDVTATEPLPEASPLWHHPHISITPHDSSMTHGTVLRADDTFVENFKRFFAGEPLKHVFS